MCTLYMGVRSIPFPFGLGWLTARTKPWQRNSSPGAVRRQHRRPHPDHLLAIRDFLRAVFWAFLSELIDEIVFV